MALKLDGRIGAGNDLLDADLRDLSIIDGPGGTFLYVSSGQNGGISVYRVDTAGGLASLSDTRYFTSSGITMGSFDLVSLDGTARLIMGGTGNGALIGYGFGADGDLSGLISNDLPGNGVETASALASTALSNGTTALYMVDGDSGALTASVSNGTGALVAKAGLTGGAAKFNLNAVVALEVIKAGSSSYLVAASGADSGAVRSYRIDPASGALNYIASLGAQDGLGVATPSAMQTLTAYGKTWVILAASGSSSLSVMKLSSGGQLEPVDHILDTLATRFGGVTALEVVKVAGRVFVLAGGADDGLALFSLLPDGRLVHMQSLAQTFGAGLENVTGIEAAVVGDELRIFVTSGAALGLSQFSLSLEDLGAVIQGSGGGGQVQGTGARDLILGKGAQDRLMGQGGDDILVSAPGGGILTGGAGADTFVLLSTTGSLRITDFERGVDRLDLSGFAMLRSLSQLDITSTGTGLTMDYGTTTIVIRSDNGQPLKASDLWPGGFDTPDRVPIPSGPVIRVMVGNKAGDILTGGARADIFMLNPIDGSFQIRNFEPGRDKLDLSGFTALRNLSQLDLVSTATGITIKYGTTTIKITSWNGQPLKIADIWPDGFYVPPIGTGGDDILSGGAGADIIRGLGGNDLIQGGAGNDWLWGDAGRDILLGGPGADVLRGGTGDDTLRGGTGNDRIWGDDGRDILAGDDGDDWLFGGEDNDRLNGDKGKDRLKGDGGDDILQGGADNDILIGGTGDDTLRGGAGNDRIWGGDGRDKLFGGGGDDWLSGGVGNDKLTGGKGEDRLKGGAGNDRLTGSKGEDRLKGGAGNDTLKGGGGRDNLKGGSGVDRLLGGNGNDKLAGGVGNDKLTGGGGRDVFIFGSGGGGHGTDRISDFTDGRDLIRIDIARTNFGDLTLTRQGGDTVIDTGVGTITVTGILPRNLDADDFLFS